MNNEKIKEFVGDKVMNLKTIASHFGIKRRSLHNTLSSTSGLKRVVDPLVHGSNQTTSNCWAKPENCGKPLRKEVAINNEE